MEITFLYLFRCRGDSVVASSVKNLLAVQETRVRSLVWEDPQEKVMVTHSSILSWKISAQQLWLLGSRAQAQSCGTLAQWLCSYILHGIICPLIYFGCQKYVFNLKYFELN